MQQCTAVTRRHKAGSEEELVTAIDGWTPEQRLELKRLDNEYNLALLNQGINIFELEVRDKESARNIVVATKNMVPQLTLAIILQRGVLRDPCGIDRLNGAGIHDPACLQGYAHPPAGRDGE
ncbi:hypothetical protein FGF68_10750 [Prosthecochloris vibrioformis]|uniref:Uncharacterized protein n=1 Tax=Prosthecochloris vibrioformis TaxID=1098 RepID=A0A5C4RSQ5_PROVB|nr:hypothetical protein FGF68_10750 [Prosthecochloris vibrioformis]